MHLGCRSAPWPALALRVSDDAHNFDQIWPLPDQFGPNLVDVTHMRSIPSQIQSDSVEISKLWVECEFSQAKFGPISTDSAALGLISTKMF